MSKNAKCRADFCDLPMVAKSLCKRHYPMFSRGRSVYGPYPDRKKKEPTPRPGCDFQGCTNRATAQKGGLCMGHYQQKTAGKKLAPLIYKNEGWTETGRICKDCKEDKPLTEYYRTNLGKEYENYRKNCKDCYKTDIGYYQGKYLERADGTDPMGWKDNPSAMQAKYEEVKRKAVEDYRKRHEGM